MVRAPQKHQITVSSCIRCGVHRSSGSFHCSCRQVALDRQEKAGRAAILKVHMRKIKPAATLVVDQIAAITPGFSGADLPNLVNEAALTATRLYGTEVTTDAFTTAVERLVAGIEMRSRLLNPGRTLHCIAERTNAARDDRDFVYGIGALERGRDQRVAHLVKSNDAPLLA